MREKMRFATDFKEERKLEGYEHDPLWVLLVNSAVSKGARANETNAGHNEKDQEPFEAAAEFAIVVILTVARVARAVDHALCQTVARMIVRLVGIQTVVFLPNIGEHNHCNDSDRHTQTSLHKAAPFGDLVVSHPRCIHGCLSLGASLATTALNQEVIT